MGKLNLNQKNLKRLFWGNSILGHQDLTTSLYLFIYCITCKADCQIPVLDKPIWFSTLSELTVVRYVKVNSVAICWHILSQILDSHQSSAQSRNFIFTSTNRLPFSIMHAKTSEEHSNASLRKSIYTTAKAKKEKMHQDQSVSKPSIISEKIKIRLKTAHFLHRLTTFFVYQNIPTPFSAFICNTISTFQKKEGQGYSTLS